MSVFLPSTSPRLPQPASRPTPTLPSGIPGIQDNSPLARFLRDPWSLLTDGIDHAAAVARWAAVALLAVIAFTVAVTLVRSVVSRWRHARLADGARLVTVLAPPEREPDAAEVLWRHLMGLLRPAWARWLFGQPHLVWEYAWAVTGLQVRLWVPGIVPPGLIERAVESSWPGARTETSPVTPPLPSNARAAGGQLRLGRAEIYPLSIEHDADPLRGLLGAASGLATGEYACVQVLARPVTGRRLVRARRAAAALRTGRSARPVSQLLDVLTPGPVPGARRSRSQPPPNGVDHAAELRAVAGKLGHSQWEAVVRYAVATTRDGEHVRGWLRGRADALATAYAVLAGRNWLARRRLRRPARVLAGRRLGCGDLLSVPELAALAHLPLDVAVPGLAMAGARAVVPPAGVPYGGKGVRVLGDADTGPRRAVAVSVPDARHHIHVLGATGSGKSTLLGQLILADARACRGLLAIDPKGDLICDVLDRLPAEAADRVVLFDPDDAGPPPALNMLEGPDPGLITDHLVGIFHRIYADSWGPRTDDVLRASCLTLLHAARQSPGRASHTLGDIPRLLTEDGFRRGVTRVLRDPVLRGFWSSYAGMSEPARVAVIAPLMNKLRAVLLRPFFAAVVASGPSTIDLGRVLDRGGVCLMRLPKGTLGADTVRLLGSFVLARAWQATIRRASVEPGARRDAAIFMDECQNFLTLPHSLDDMLAEARAYRVSLVLAHQHLAQLPKDLREGISANARNKLYFATSPEDARDLAYHTSPYLNAHDLAHLGAYQVAARLLAGGQETAAFTFRTRDWPEAVVGRAEQIRRVARARHGLTHDRARAHHDDPRRRFSTRPAGGDPASDAVTVPDPRGHP
jgi:hypothetical protein